MSNFLLHLAQSSGGVATGEASLPRAEPVTQPSALATPDLSTVDSGIEEGAFGEHQTPTTEPERVSPIGSETPMSLVVAAEPVRVEAELVTPSPRPAEVPPEPAGPKTSDSSPEIPIEPPIVTSAIRSAETPDDRAAGSRVETKAAGVDRSSPEPRLRDTASPEPTVRGESGLLPVLPPEVKTPEAVAIPNEASMEPWPQVLGDTEPGMSEVIVPKPTTPELQQPQSPPADSREAPAIMVVEPSLRPLAPEALPLIEPAPQPAPEAAPTAPKAAPEPPPVQVRIGRVEVKAKAPASPAPEPPAPTPVSRGFGRYQHLRTYARRF